jgi:pyruvate kinase
VLIHIGGSTCAERNQLARLVLPTKTKIVCTLGPATASARAIRAILKAGANVVRLNFSHGDHGTHALAISRVRKIAADLGLSVPIMQDLQGPRFRVRELAGHEMQLKRGMAVSVSNSAGGEGVIPVSPPYTFEGVHPGDTITFGDYGISLKVVSAGQGSLECKVTRGGTISDRTSVNFPSSSARFPALTRKDVADLKFGIEQGVDLMALSFVRQPGDLLALRKHIKGTGIGVVSKIETRQALETIDGIIANSDAVLVARGDLAKEISISEVPVAQKTLIEKCNRMATPVITATQMLESMIHNPQPTRAEATDVANAVFDGSDALMLSGETAIGDHPVEAVRVMVNLIKAAEKAQVTAGLRRKRPMEPEAYVDEIIAALAVEAAGKLGARCIVTFTMSGSTALRVAKFRPDVPIFAVTPVRQTRMRLALSYGTLCEEVSETRDMDKIVAGAVDIGRRHGFLKKGDLVVVTAGMPPMVSGKTNMLKVEEV